MSLNAFLLRESIATPNEGTRKQSNLGQKFKIQIFSLISLGIDKTFYCYN